MAQSGSISKLLLVAVTTGTVEINKSYCILYPIVLYVLVRISVQVQYVLNRIDVLTVRP